MADQSRYPDTSESTGAGPDRAEGMPRWVKVLLITLGVAVLLFLAGTFLLPGDDGGHGGHGPGGHASSGGPTLSFSVVPTALAVQAPKV